MKEDKRIYSLKKDTESYSDQLGDNYYNIEPDDSQKCSVSSDGVGMNSVPNKKESTYD